MEREEVIGGAEAVLPAPPAAIQSSPARAPPLAFVPQDCAEYSPEFVRVTSAKVK